MSAFKIKHDRTKHLIQINTLDETHKKFMNDFQQRRDQLPKKKKRIEQLKNKLCQIESDKKTTYTIEEIKKRADYKSEIQTLEEEVFDIENDLSELEYYCKTEDIIMDYYEITETDDNILYNDNPDLCMEKVIDISNNHIDKLDILNKISNEKKKVKKVINRRKKKTITYDQPNILDFLTRVNSTRNPNNDILTEIHDSDKMIDDENQDNNSEQNKSKTQLLEQYMMIIDSDYTYDKKKNTSKIKKCEKCNIEKTLNYTEGIYFCPGCAEVELVIFDSEKPNYKEAVADTKPGYPYKRLNHLNEWLAQFQAKESIDIPDEIYNNILAELRKNRFKDLKQLNLVYMKKILKKLDLQQYYEHSTYIISKLSKVPPPTINRETEEKIRLMFRQIQIPFGKYCPKNRTNFLSYSYVLHKIFELLELDDFVKYFPLLKSRDKLKQQDEIWEKICEELEWDFYPSI